MMRSWRMKRKAATARQCRRPRRHPHGDASPGRARRGPNDPAAPFRDRQADRAIGQSRPERDGPDFSGKAQSLRRLSPAGIVASFPRELRNSPIATARPGGIITRAVMSSWKAARRSCFRHFGGVDKIAATPLASAPRAEQGNSHGFDRSVGLVSGNRWSARRHGGAGPALSTSVNNAPPPSPNIRSSRHRPAGRTMRADAPRLHDEGDCRRTGGAVTIRHSGDPRPPPGISSRFNGLPLRSTRVSG